MPDCVADIQKRLANMRKALEAVARRLNPNLSLAERAGAQVEGWILGVSGLIRQNSSAKIPRYPPLVI
jgi:hypothetical protein